MRSVDLRVGFVEVASRGIVALRIGCQGRLVGAGIRRRLSFIASASDVIWLGTRPACPGIRGTPRLSSGVARGSQTMRALRRLAMGTRAGPPRMPGRTVDRERSKPMPAPTRRSAAGAGPVALGRRVLSRLHSL